MSHLFSHVSLYTMPSGHAATSIGLMTYILLEMFVCHPNMLCGLTCQKRDIRRWDSRILRVQLEQLILNDFTEEPWLVSVVIDYLLVGKCYGES